MVPTRRVTDTAILNPLEQYRAIPTRDAWHFAKSENTCKIFDIRMVDAVRASHGALKLHTAMASVREEALEIRARCVEIEQEDGH